jgi:hypothetical protein
MLYQQDIAMLQTVYGYGHGFELARRATLRSQDSDIRI